MKHFEQLWEESELVSSQSDPSTNQDKINAICDKIKLLNTDPNNNFEIFGEVLFKLCGLSKNLNVNTFAALFKTMQDEKMELME